MPGSHVAAPRLGPTLQFLRALWDLSHALEVTSSRMLRKYGITAQQRFLIRIVGRAGPLTAGTLAQLLHVHPGTLSAALTRLEGRGLLERKRDPEDARRVLILLTARGRKLDAAARGSVENAVSTVLRQASPGDASKLLQTINRLAEELRGDGTGSQG